MTAPDIETTPIYFAEEILGIHLYDWQANVLTWFEGAVGKRLKASLCTPNGAGKDSVIIATLALWWVSMHTRGRVVITSKDSRQIDEQTCPALQRHQGKFDGWKWIDRYVETKTGGKIILFTTDESARCEGFHRETLADGTPNPDGPLLVVANEAKSIDPQIFEAFARCTYDAILYASSPGMMQGAFYESQMNGELGFKRLRIGLKDCPHVPQARIDDIIATYGPDSPFTRSTLHGEFMEASTELRFNPTGLKRLTDMALAYETRWKAETAARPSASPIGELVDQANIHGPIQWLPDLSSGWVWIAEHPEPGLEYIGFADPMTGAQSEGSLKRDTAGTGILRKAYIDAEGHRHEDEVVAVLHSPGEGVRWDNDILAERFDLLLRYYGDCTAIVESNNSGTEVMRLLQIAGRKLWRRKKRDAVNPGKMLQVVGFQTNSATKNLWIGALGRAIREEELSCTYRPACEQFATFILTEDGSGEAQPSCHDDFVTGIGLALFARNSASRYPMPRTNSLQPRAAVGAWSG